MKNKVKIKWKLKDFDASKQQNNNHAIKVEWAKIDLVDKKKEMELNLNNSKSFVINNYNNNEWNIVRYWRGERKYFLVKK